MAGEPPALQEKDLDHKLRTSADCQSARRMPSCPTEMPQPTAACQTKAFRFGSFELDLDAGELRKQGRKIRLQEKPLRTLAFLLEHAGEVVTREQLREHLWPVGTFVEFDDNLNTTIKRVRDALGDTAESPRYLETIPRRGYRFIPPVESIAANGKPASAAPISEPSGKSRLIAFCAAGLAIGLAAAVWLWRASRPDSTQPGGRIMLAVLPFRNLSGDPRQDYVSDGMTEELIAHLGRLTPRKLGVISRSSVMRFKTAMEDAAAIGHELGVTYLLEGSVSRLDGRVQVTAQLIQAWDRTHSWAETYERPTSDLLLIQRDVSRRVAEAIAVRLLPSQQAVLARAATTNTEAYDSYLADLYQLNRGTRESFQNALRAFELAASLDPGFAPAHDGMARTYLDLAGYHFMPEQAAYGKAREHIDAALRIDDSIPESQALQAALLRRVNPGAPGIEAAYQKAIALNPSDARTRHDHALYFLSRQRQNEAIGEIAEAVRLDPLSPAVICDRAWIFFASKQYDHAQDAVKRALELDPNFPYASYIQGQLDTHAGQLDKAISTFGKAVDSSGRTPKYLFALAGAYIQAGRKTEAQALFEELRGQARNEYVPPEYLSELGRLLKNR
jgi:TolB-like protein/DNA-binding winged helix-turn-helix (wHTH) protein/thioredoxin-like negative regulator of GroEL